jgi:hypothetical protein
LLKSSGGAGRDAKHQGGKKICLLVGIIEGGQAMVIILQFAAEPALTAKDAQGKNFAEAEVFA